MAAGFTTIRFGTVLFYRCITRIVDQTPQMDASGTGLMYQKTKIAISGYLDGSWYINQPYVSGFTSTAPKSQYPLAWGETETSGGGPAVPNDPKGNASVREQDIRRKLYPRQAFVMTVGDFNGAPSGGTNHYPGDGSGGNVLLACYPAPVNPNNPNMPAQSPGMSSSSYVNTYGQTDVNLSDQDLNNGPICTSFKITGVHGDNLYCVDAEFEICMLECDINGNVPGNDWGILSNKWSCHDYLNADLRTTRTYNGTLRLASQINAQQLRWLCLPPVVPMFRRDHFEFIVAEDGLTLKWMVVDQEIAASAPYPAKTWSVVSGTASTTGMKARQSVEVTLTADVNTNKRDLVELALYIMTIKVFGQNPLQINQANINAGGRNPPVNNNNQYLVESLEFVDYIGDEIRITGRMAATAPLAAAGKNPNSNVIMETWAQQGKNFGAELDASLLTNSALIKNSRPLYDRRYSQGAYKIGAPVQAGQADFLGDTTAYASPAASITQIFLNYLQYPCGDTHATYNGPGTPGPGGSGPYYNRNLDPLDRNETPYVVVTPPDNDNTTPPRDPYNTFPPTYNTTVVPSGSPILYDNPYVSAGQQVLSYTHWQLQNLYRTKHMRMVCPIASVAFPDSPTTGPQAAMYNVMASTSVGQVANPQTIRIVRIMAERIGGEPQFPDINTWFASFGEVENSVSPTGYGPGWTIPPIPTTTPDPDPEWLNLNSYSDANSNVTAAYYAGQTPVIFQWPIRMKIKPSTVVTTVTGQLLYSAVAEYHIALSRAPNPGERLELGNNMWDNLGRQRTDSNGQLTAAIWDIAGNRTTEAKFISS